MRVLVSSAYYLIAYPIVRSLRAETDFVALYGPDQPGTGIALSRFVDAAHHVALPRRVPPGAVTPGEALVAQELGHVERLLRICAGDGLEVIIPTSDYDLLLLSRHREAFEAAGVRVAVPSHDAVVAAMDKYRSAVVGAESGLPTPATVLLEEGEAARAGEEVGWPAVVKPRFSTGSIGVQLADGPEEAERAARAVRGWAGGVVLQEYIHGSREPSITVVMDGDSRPLFVTTLRKWRYANPSLSTVIETVPHLPETDAALRFLANLGIVGPAAIQLKHDERSGVHRFIEVNPRWGANARILLPLATRARTNAAVACLHTALGRSGLPRRDPPPGLVGASPAEDLYALRTWRAARAATRRSDNPVPSVLTLAASYVRTYARAGVTLDAFVAGLRDDRAAVLPSLRRTLREAARPSTDFVPWGFAGRGPGGARPQPASARTSDATRASASASTPFK